MKIFTKRKKSTFLSLLSKVCVSVCLVAQLCPILYDSMDCSLPDSSVCGILQTKNTGVGYPGIEPTPPALAGRVFTTVPPGKAPLSSLAEVL